MDRYWFGAVVEYGYFAGNDFCEISEGKGLKGGVLKDRRPASISGLGDALNQGDSAENRQAGLSCQVIHTAFSENKVFVVWQFGGSEPSHVFNNANYRHVYCR